jgi:hypothetical protein
MNNINDLEKIKSLTTSKRFDGTNWALFISWIEMELDLTDSLDLVFGGPIDLEGFRV